MKQLDALLQKKHFSFIGTLRKQFPNAEVFLVGGIVRDAILKRESKDYDFVVRNVPMKHLQAALSQLGSVDLVGKTFGVLKFVPQGAHGIEPIDIALPRTEHAFMTGGYRDVDVQSNPKLPIAEDLQRRDFTINALAYDIANKKLIDLFGGVRDIRKKRILTVGTPAERFREDYSRMLRALRFACQLGFTIEAKTWAELKKRMEAINAPHGEGFVVPREVIAKELARAFVADPVRALDLHDTSTAMDQLMPELLAMKGCPQPRNFHTEGDVWKHTRLALKNLSSKRYRTKFGSAAPSAELVFGLLFHDLGKPATKERRDRLRFNNHDTVGSEQARVIMERLKLSSAGVDVEKTVWLCRKHMIVTHTKKSPMRSTTLEKYFFNPRVPGDDLMKLMFADVQATVPATGKPDFTEYRMLEQQVGKLAAIAKKRKILPPDLLNGNEIMKLRKLGPGPQIGKLKSLLREQQLRGTVTTKQEATDYLSTHA
ncbi:MAG: HD domain-containing protein [Patescibacteria group bacterium]|nr:HD domain-containing protein [Patescibacteria group bacterium]MDD5715599.1 HD domain-containing protein [Patescibacteria group bacterium]